jgi:hypothetical protein
MTDQVFNIHQILEKKWEYNGTVHQLFIDLNKAYDSVRREVLYNILIEFEIPRKLVGMIKMCLNETYSRLGIGKSLSDKFLIQNDLKQGDALVSIKKAGEKHSIMITNRSFEGVAEFKYLGTTLTDQNYIQEEIKSRLNLGNACYHSVQSLLSSHLLSRNVKVKIYKTIILPVVLYGCESWSLTLREERRLRVLENRVLRRIFGPKRAEVTGGWRK